MSREADVGCTFLFYRATADLEIEILTDPGRRNRAAEPPTACRRRAVKSERTRQHFGPRDGDAYDIEFADDHFASWIGITPRENSTAGRQKLGRICRAGDEDLRRLLVIGATAVIRDAKPGRTSPWLLALLARKSKKLAAVALANKMARIVRAMMVSGETYRQPAQA